MRRSLEGREILIKAAIDNGLELLGVEGQRVAAAIGRIFGGEGGEEGVSKPSGYEGMSVIGMRCHIRGRREIFRQRSNGRELRLGVLHIGGDASSLERANALFIG